VAATLAARAVTDTAATGWRRLLERLLQEHDCEAINFSLGAAAASAALEAKPTGKLPSWLLDHFGATAGSPRRNPAALCRALLRYPNATQLEEALRQVGLGCRAAVDGREVPWVTPDLIDDLHRKLEASAAPPSADLARECFAAIEAYLDWGARPASPPLDSRSAPPHYVRPVGADKPREMGADELMDQLLESAVDVVGA